MRLARKRNQEIQKAKVQDTETAPEQVKEDYSDREMLAVTKGQGKPMSKEMKTKVNAALAHHDAMRKKQKAARGVKEDKAFSNVVAALRAKHGKDAVLTKDSPNPKPQPKRKPKPQKPLTAAEKAHREVIARYGGEANYRAGRGLGT